MNLSFTLYFKYISRFVINVRNSKSTLYYFLNFTLDLSRFRTIEIGSMTIRSSPNLAEVGRNIGTVTRWQGWPLNVTIALVIREGKQGTFRKRIAQLRNGTRLHTIDGVIYDVKSAGGGKRRYCP